MFGGLRLAPGVRVALERRCAGACESCGLEWPWALYVFRVEDSGRCTVANLIVLCGKCSTGREGEFAPLVGTRTARDGILTANNGRAGAVPLTDSKEGVDSCPRRSLRGLRSTCRRARARGSSPARGVSGRRRPRGEPAGPVLCLPPPPSTVCERLRRLGRQEIRYLPQVSAAQVRRAVASANRCHHLRKLLRMTPTRATVR